MYLYFDLDDAGRQDVLAALENRKAGVIPVEALRLFAHQAVAEQRPYILFCEAESDRFVETVPASQALVARARAIHDELSDLLANALAKAAGPHSRTLAPVWLAHSSSLPGPWRSLKRIGPSTVLKVLQENMSASLPSLIREAKG